MLYLIAFIFLICHIKAFEWDNKSLVSLFTLPMAGLRDLSWINDDSYVAAFEVIFIMEFMPTCC
jgi:hypothetical protein